MLSSSCHLFIVLFFFFDCQYRRIVSTSYGLDSFALYSSARERDVSISICVPQLPASLVLPKLSSRQLATPLRPVATKFKRVASACDRCSGVCESKPFDPAWEIHFVCRFTRGGSTTYLCFRQAEGFSSITFCVYRLRGSQRRVQVRLKKAVR